VRLLLAVNQAENLNFCSFWPVPRICRTVWLVKPGLWSVRTAAGYPRNWATASSILTTCSPRILWATTRSKASLVKSSTRPDSAYPAVPVSDAQPWCLCGIYTFSPSNQPDCRDDISACGWLECLHVPAGYIPEPVTELPEGSSYVLPYSEYQIPLDSFREVPQVPAVPTGGYRLLLPAQ